VPAEKTPTGTSTEVLAVAVALSRQMLEAAKSGDWDRLAALEHERSRQLGAGLSSSLTLTPAAAAEVKALLANCLRLNDEIAALTGAHMSRLSELLAEMTQTPPGSDPPPRPPG